MYAYTEFDQSFIERRAAQFRDQLTRWQSGELSEDEFKPLRLQNGWYVQRFAPMLRVAVPYGVISARQLRVLAQIAREYDHKDLQQLDRSHAGLSDVDALPDHCAHFTTRQNVQFNWIPLSKSADVMDLLASVGLHGIQTSGNCIRNTTTDAFAGIAPDELADPRPFAELIRQWSTLHPEFAFLPRKFKVAITGATEDRAATRWHDVGLRLVADATDGLGFEVSVGGGMGRTPVIGTTIKAFVPAFDILDYLTAIIRVYNRWGRRDNLYKARIKILVKAQGQAYIDEVDAEFASIQTVDGSPNRITPAQYARVAKAFEAPARDDGALPTAQKMAEILAAAFTGGSTSTQLDPLKASEGKPHDLGQCYIIIDPTNVAGDLFWEKLSTISEAVTSQPGARIPGANKVLPDAVELDANVWESVKQLAGI